MIRNSLKLSTISAALATVILWHLVLSAQWAFDYYPAQFDYIEFVDDKVKERRLGKIVIRDGQTELEKHMLDVVAGISDTSNQETSAVVEPRVTRTDIVGWPTRFVRVQRFEDQASLSSDQAAISVNIVSYLLSLLCIALGGCIVHIVMWYVRSIYAKKLWQLIGNQNLE